MCIYNNSTPNPPPIFEEQKLSFCFSKKKNTRARHEYKSTYLCINGKRMCLSFLSFYEAVCCGRDRESRTYINGVR